MSIRDSLSTDWFSLVDNTPSNGSFVTTFSIPSNQYRIRISEALTGSPMAYSDGVFTISAQPVRTIGMIAPNGGEQWIVGTTNAVSYTHLRAHETVLDLVCRLLL